MCVVSGCACSTNRGLSQCSHMGSFWRRQTREPPSQSCSATHVATTGIPPSPGEPHAAAPSCCLPAARDRVADEHTPKAGASALLHFPIFLFIQLQSVTLLPHVAVKASPLRLFSDRLHRLHQDNLAYSKPLVHKFPIHGAVFTSTSGLRLCRSITMTESPLK